MSGRKKKLSVKLKRYNIMLITALIVLMILLGVMMLFQMLGHRAVYKVESRQSNIEKSKKKDKQDFETIGWVRVQGTNIDYPLYGLINPGYEYPVNESFLWSLNYDSRFHDTMIVYGHNLLNLGAKPRAHDDKFIRMEELMNFVYYDFAQENQYIQLSIDEKDYLYKIFAANFVYYSDVNMFPGGDWSKEDKKDYVNRLLEESIYDYDTDYKDSDKIISVVTCSRFFGDGLNYDFIVTGRLVRPDESITLSKVHRNRNYEIIDQKNKEVKEDAEFA